MDGNRYFELNLEHFEFLYDAKRSTVMVPHFFIKNLKVEFLTIQSSWSIDLLIKLASLLFSQLIQVISRFIFFALQMSKIHQGFFLQFGFATTWFWKFWKGAQVVIYCFQFSPCGTPIFFCARKVFLDQIFFPVYFKTCTDPTIACVRMHFCNW